MPKDDGAHVEPPEAMGRRTFEIFLSAKEAPQAVAS
jgi:hypothetical protein